MLSVFIPISGEANTCHDFPWQLLPAVDEPPLFTKGRLALSNGLGPEAREAFQTFIRTKPDHELIEGARFSLASIMVENTDKEGRFLETIGNLRSMRQRYPESEISPWALCQMGDLYRQGGWFYEAKGTFEQFLKSYPDHSLTPGVLNGAGRNFLDNDQSLEAALVFRRVLDEPRWTPFHLEAALGLADGAAASKAWEEARYWYDTVALEAPELLRASSGSLYRRGLTEWELGGKEKSFTQFLTAFNLYPNDNNGGLALIQLARMLSHRGEEVPALWFANQAIQRFPEQEPEYVGRGVLLEWAFSDLQKGPDAVFESEVRSRLAELGIAVPVTWNEFRAEAAKLAMVRKPEISGMARFWMAQSHEIEGRPQQAMQGYVQVVVHYSGTIWESRAAEAAKRILSRFHTDQDWVSLLSFFDQYPGIFVLLKPDPRLNLMIADGYMALNLPKQALAWLDRVLDQSPPPIIQEDALGKKVKVAEQTGHKEAVKVAGLEYERSYPDGPQLTKVAMTLGKLAVEDTEYPSALGHYAKALSHVSTREEKRKVMRDIIQVFRKSGQVDKAIQGFRRLMLDYGETPEDRAILGDLLFEAGQYQLAVDEYVKLRESDPSPKLQLWAKYRLAVGYRYLRKVGEAKRLLDELTEVQGSSGQLDHAIRAAALAQRSEFLLMADNEKVGSSKQ